MKARYKIKISGGFEAAHFLRAYNPDGSDEMLHGHSWKVFLTLSNKRRALNGQGIVVDFLALRPEFDQRIAELHHTCINKHKDFIVVNPTAENIACWFFEKLQPFADSIAIEIIEIAVEEKPGHLAICTPDQ